MVETVVLVVKVDKAVKAALVFLEMQEIMEQVVMAELVVLVETAA
jgi:hypothetical protein